MDFMVFKINEFELRFQFMSENVYKLKKNIFCIFGDILQILNLSVKFRTKE